MTERRNIQQGPAARALGRESQAAGAEPATPGAVIASQAERVERFLRSKLANPADAQDLAQEAYLRLLRVRDPKLIEDPVAYLFRIARNLVGELYTKLPPAAESLDDVELADNGATVEGKVEHGQQMDRLTEVLSHLAPKCRAALILHRRDGMTVDEIAVELKLSRGMVKKHLAQGLARCRARLRRFHE
jgi:RNA polymerase sigma-70 factor (ECF subfamily)